jgi:hypothetical protein
MDHYIMAVQCWEDAIDRVKKSETLHKKDLDLLRYKRKLAETNILIAEQLLASPQGEDMITFESKTLLVPKLDKIKYAQGYYDNAKDELQDVVYLMGKLTSEGHDMDADKEDICFLATMIMGVGMTLEDSYPLEKTAVDPSSKKPKRFK